MQLHILTFLLTTLSLHAQVGTVIKVKDGDTIVILDDDYTQHTIRIADIDCPEKGQPFGTQAKKFTSRAIFGKEVSVREKTKDHYGRSIGYVTYDNDKDLGQELLKVGLAWHYAYYSDDEYLASLQREARKHKRGLWVEPDPINPYQWRKGKR